MIINKSYLIALKPVTDITFFV